VKEVVPLKLPGSAEEPAPEALEPEPEPEPEAEDEDTYCCDRCGEEVHPENAIVTDGGEGPYCEDCYYELYGRCANCDREIFLDDAWQDGNGEMYCERCYERIFTECAACGNELWRDDAIWVDGEAYCEDCAVEHVVEHVEVE
jgi:formylmethanofuran dehydrogenase subunit E